MAGLTVKGQQYATIAGSTLAVLIIVFLMGRCAGARAATETADTKAERVLSARLDTALKRADSLAKVTVSLQKAVTASVQPHERAKAKTDTAGTAELVARAALEATLHDTAATLAAVRAAADSLARRDSAAFAAFAAERIAASARIAAMTRLISADSATLIAQAQVIQQGKQDRDALAQVIKDLKAKQPSLFRRIADGAIDVVAAGACGAVGSLISPAGAVIAGSACLAGAAAWSP